MASPSVSFRPGFPFRGDANGSGKPDAHFLSSLLGDAKNYLATKPDDQEIDLFADGVEVTKLQLLLSDAEFRTLNGGLLELIMAAAKNEPAPDRTRRVLSLTIIPVGSKSGDSS